MAAPTKEFLALWKKVKEIKKTLPDDAQAVYEREAASIALEKQTDTNNIEFLLEKSKEATQAIENSPLAQSYIEALEARSVTNKV